jgi:hypothetical protein
VIATIALFAALGGGYAMAFSGSGSLQKKGSEFCPTEFGDYRTLAGFGALQLNFDTTPSPQLQVRFKNTSMTRDMIIDWFDWEDGPSPRVEVQPNSTQAGQPFVLDSTGANRGEFHLSKQAPDGTTAVKAGVMGIVRATIISGGEGAACTEVHTMALNTQEP